MTLGFITQASNFPDPVVENLPSDAPCGVYYGWASVDNGPVRKMVMSIGWNPYYKNTKKTMETHIMHTFQDDFYGSNLKVIMLGYIRPMRNFTSLDELIEAIRSDIAEANKFLEQPKSQVFKTNNFFTPAPATNGHTS